MRKALAIAFMIAASAGDVRGSDLLKGGIYDWNGAYVGAHAGSASGETKNSWRNMNFPEWRRDGDISYDSAAGGVYAGYLWQRGPLAYGIEGDLTWASLSGNDSKFAGLVNELEMAHFGTVRARLGYAYGSALLFATAGLAVGEIEKKDLTLKLANSNALVGWTVGGGIEYAVFGDWRARAEYQFIDFGSVVSSLGYDHRADNVEIHTVRGGISYGF